MSPKTNEALRECPFCGSNAVYDAKRIETGKTFWFVRCMGCGMRTANRSSPSAAFYRWNTRIEEEDSGDN